MEGKRGRERDGYSGSTSYNDLNNKHEQWGYTACHTQVTLHTLLYTLCQEVTTAPSGDTDTLHYPSHKCTSGRHSSLMAEDGSKDMRREFE